MIEGILKELEDKGYKANKFSKIKPGINSSTYLLESNKKKFILKLYITNKVNKINRLQHEKQFLEFLDACNIKNVPKLLLWNSKKNWILISCMEGRKVNKGNYSLSKQLINFLIELQKHRKSKYAENLQLASEACLSISHHLKSVKNRVNLFYKELDTLTQININLNDELKNLLKENISEINYQYKYLQENNYNDFYNELTKEKRIISQSDVGFHNMLNHYNLGKFFDFEYAGWDDPGKLFCDLILQPDHNIPIKYLSLLDEYFENFILNANYSMRRINIMLSIYRLKWSMIILNPIIKNFDNNNLAEIKLLKAKNYKKESLLRIEKINKRYK